MASDDPVDDLFSVAPDAFVAARNALVKQLRAQGARERATEVAALRRPSVPDWALNVVATGHPDQLAPFLEAADHSRQAQRAAASGAEGVDLRGALQELRATADSLVRAGARAAASSGKTAGALTPLLAARLQEVAASAGLAEQLRRGRLGTGDPEPDDLFDGDAPPARARAAKAGSTRKRSAGKATAPEEVATPAPDPKRLRQLEREVASARRALEQAEAKLSASADRLEAAEHAAAKAAAALAKVQDDRDRAGEALGRAQAATEAARRDAEEREAVLKRERTG